MSNTNQTTRQGVRDLGGNGRPRKAVQAGCNHSWMTVRHHDGWTDRVGTEQRCELCHEVRS